MALSKREEKKAKKRGKSKQRNIFSNTIRDESMRYLRGQGIPVAEKGQGFYDLLDILDCELKFGRGVSKADTQRRAYHALKAEGFCSGLAEVTPLIGKARKNPGSIQKQKKKNPSTYQINTSGFYSTEDWRIVRYKALKLSNGLCQCCGAGPMPGKPLHVDHIKPRSKFPQLELVLSNLQVLCEDCNLGKLAWDDTDWRSDEIKEKCLLLVEKFCGIKILHGNNWRTRTCHLV